MQPNYGTPPNNYLVWAILTTILCCLPFGIVSIIKAAEVNSKWAGGDITGAYASSAAAKKWAIVSAGVSAGVIAIYFLFGVTMGVNSSF